MRIYRADRTFLLGTAPSVDVNTRLLSTGSLDLTTLSQSAFLGEYNPGDCKIRNYVVRIFKLS